MTVARRTKRRTKLEKQAQDVIGDLLNGLTQEETAKKYAVAPSSMSNFVARHAADIAERRNAVVEQVRDRQIADKAWRINEYASLYDLAKQEQATAEASSDRLAAIKEARGSLKAVAEELGQLPRAGDTTIQHMQVLIRQYNSDTEGI
jgi:hypothetical protein